MHRGSIALSQVEHNGIRVDVDYLDRQIKRSEKRINILEAELKCHPIYKKMRRRFGSAASLGSRDHVAHIIFNELGYECKEWTEGKVDRKTGERKKRPKADAQTLRDVCKGEDREFVDKLIRRDNTIKDKTTFLEGIRREVHNGRLRTFFNLAGGTADDTKGDPRTYRSSSDSPNVHNFPIRDPERGKLIRRAFIPSEGHVLIEADFKGIEVSIAYCYHKDPTMRTYLLDKTTDMHRDMAIECYKLEDLNCTKEWWKDKSGGHNCRYAAKNKFTFPQFYGDYWMQCAKNLWDDIGRLELKTPDGESLYKHLKRHGIKRLGDQDMRADPRPGTFEKHLKEVEANFWNVRFPVYNKWKKQWYDKYLDRGWFQMKTGFVCSGIYKKNQVINYPVQGAAFHCLLWCLIELQDWLNENKMKTKIVSQIHDSLIIDAHRSEVKEVVAKLQDIMRRALLEKWKWIIVPLEVEIDIAEENWYQKVGYDEWTAA